VLVRVYAPVSQAASHNAAVILHPYLDSVPSCRANSGPVRTQLKTYKSCGKILLHCFCCIFNLCLYIRKMSSSYFNSNIWYQISNAALGGSVSLDVLNADGASLDGNVDMTLSKFLSGQLWQILIANTTTNGYYIANQLSGAQNKLDISKNSEQDYIPFLKPFNVTYNQTWNIYRTGTITKFGNATYIFEPTYFHGGQALTAGENSTVLPFLSSTGCPRQQWVVTAVSRIDDPAFSPTAILSTSFSVQKTVSWPSSKIVFGLGTSFIDCLFLSRQLRPQIKII